MRLLSIRLIVSLIAGITLVSLSSSYYEVLGEKLACAKIWSGEPKYWAKSSQGLWSLAWRKIHYR